MITAHTAINVGTAASAQLQPRDQIRTYLEIQIYDTSMGDAFVAFGFPATAGTLGELKIKAGQSRIWCEDTTRAPPIESINIIGVGGQVTGAIIVGRS